MNILQETKNVIRWAGWTLMAFFETVEALLQRGRVWTRQFLKSVSCNETLWIPWFNVDLARARYDDQVDHCFYIISVCSHRQ